jgi:hypothetical protein
MMGVAFADTTPTTTASTPTIGNFTIESVVPIASVNSAALPSIPADVLSAITGGAIEIRQQISYDSVAKKAKLIGLLEQPGSPLPTPAGSTTGITQIWSYTVDVDRAVLSSKPVMALLISGTISSGGASAPFGDVSGALVTVSASYIAPDASAGTNALYAYANVSTDVAGVASLFSKNGKGTFAMPGSSGSPVKAVAGPPFIVNRPQFQLNGTGSTGTGLTYNWTYLRANGPISVMIQGANTATPTITVPDYLDAAGDYKFQLTVTDAAGNMSTDTVTVTYDIPTRAASPLQ